uniref:Uncharacterized protein n=1 Tax=Oryza nivara TaxID=4536 RepID=A0A0E0GWG4_ORYNI
MNSALGLPICWPRPGKARRLHQEGDGSPATNQTTSSKASPSFPGSPSGWVRWRTSDRGDEAEAAMGDC